MDDIRQRLDQDLMSAVARLHRLHRPVPVPKLPEAIGDNSPFADEVDGSQVNESLEIAFATRELLLARVNRLSAALERIGEGDYGRSEEHTSELQSPCNLVCRLLLEKKKKQ